MLGPGGAVDEIPLLEEALFAFDQQEALAGEHQEILLGVLPVIPAVGLLRTPHLDVDPEVGESGA